MDISPRFAFPSGRARLARLGRSIVTSLPLLIASERPIRPQEADLPGASCIRLLTDDRIGDEIAIHLVDDSVTARVVEQAVERWRRCDGYGTDFPRFAVGIGRGLRVEVRFERERPGDGYCGVFAGQTITLYRLARVNDRIVACPRSSRVLAHELGHVLGLRDIDGASGCQSFIMSEIVTTGPALQRVAQAECGAVSRRWSTSGERIGEAAASRGPVPAAGGTVPTDLPP